MDKTVHDVRKSNDILSEFAHPNWRGVFGIYAKTDRAKSTAHLVDATLATLRSAEEFDFGLAEPQEIRGCGRYRPVDREHRELELVAGRHLCGEHDAVRHVETLDRVRAGPPSGARHFAVNPDLGIIVDINPQHRHCPCGVEAQGVDPDRPGPTIPTERQHPA